MKPEKIFCKDCGKLLSRQAYYFGYLYCKSCAKIGSNHPNYIDGRTSKNTYCIDCGNKVSTYKTIRCKKCFTLYVKMNRTKFFGYIDGRTSKKYYCIDCKKQISISTIRRKRNHCQSCSMKLKFKDPRNHPTFLGGKTFEPYGIEFNNNLKEQIRFRDKYKCFLCECPQIENGRKLCVHHVDYNKKNNSFGNLVALCRNCHLKTNQHRDRWIKFIRNIIKFKKYSYVEK